MNAPLLRLFAATGALALLSACASSPADNPATEAALQASDWALVQWSGHTIPPSGDSEPVILRFAPDGRASGHAGCNRFFSSYNVSAPGQVSVGLPGSTRMACEREVMQFENSYLAALPKMTAFAIKGEQLSLRGQDGGLQVYQARPREVTAPASDEAVSVTKMELEVASARASCVGVVRMQCLKVRRNASGPWELWYDPIEGFDYKPGVVYRILVSGHKVANPPADSSSMRWKLEKILVQQQVGRSAKKSSSEKK